MDLQALARDLKAAGQLSDFLTELGQTKGLYNCTTGALLPEGPYGNIYRRSMALKEFGAQFEGHEHNYDHITYLIRGKVLRKTIAHKGAPAIEEIFEAPSAMLIRAECWHEFTALTDDVIAECVYAIRDSKTGNIVPVYDGGSGPYG